MNGRNTEIGRVEAAQAAELVRRFVSETPEGRAHGAALDAGTDLFEAGLLDSFRLVELILYLERELEAEIDLTDADPDSLTTIAGIAGQIAAIAQPAAG